MICFGGINVSIVAKSFFHFTPSEDYLLSIIKNKFSPRYCREDFTCFFGAGSQKVYAYIPMVCFCDIPLTEIKEHSKEYGEYGIGLKKEWGEKNLNPIFYLQQGSIPAHSLGKLKLTKEESEKKKAEKHFDKLLAFCKNYKGKSSKNKKEKEFYKEREWRWISELPNDKELVIFSQNMHNKQEMNELIKNNILDFDTSDVSYVFVPNNEEKIKLAYKIFEIFRVQNNLNQGFELITKIISLEEIDDDF